MKEVSKKVGENLVTELTDILVYFRYFYNYTFENSYDYNELKNRYNFLVVEVLYPTHVYEKLKQENIILLTEQNSKYNFISTSNPKVSKEDRETIKRHHIKFPAKYYFDLKEDSIKYNYKLALKFDEQHYLITNSDLHKGTINDLIERELINETNAIEPTEIYINRIISEIKNNILNERQKIMLVNSIASIVDNVDHRDINLLINDIIMFYKKNYHVFPKKISQGIDIELFSIYVSSLPLISKTSSKREITSFLTEYVSGFFLH